ncbi:MAG: RidA family protein [Pseudomonadota bacterium]
MPREVIVPDDRRDTYESLKFAPATRAGDMIYLSGIVASYRDGETEADQEAAIERAFVSIDSVLKASGAGWDDIVDVTTYHVDMMSHVGAYTRVKDRWIKQPYPSWTAIGVTRLFPERSLVEIKVTAYAPQ